MSENKLCKKNKVPNYYLFTGYYSDDRLVSKVKPLPNTLVLAGDPATVVYKKGEPVLLRTNQNGVLHGLSEKENYLLAPKNPYVIKSVTTHPLKIFYRRGRRERRENQGIEKSYRPGVKFYCLCKQGYRKYQLKGYLCNND